MQLNQIDAAIAAISVTPDRRNLVVFTNLYYIGEDAALMRGDLHALSAWGGGGALALGGCYWVFVHRHMK